MDNSKQPASAGSHVAGLMNRRSEIQPVGQSPVMVVYHGVVQHVAYSRDVGEWIAADGGSSDHMPHSFVSHWSPLPSPPITEASKDGTL